MHNSISEKVTWGGQHIFRRLLVLVMHEVDSMPEDDAGVYLLLLDVFKGRLGIVNLRLQNVPLFLDPGNNNQ